MLIEILEHNLRRKLRLHCTRSRLTSSGGILDQRAFLIPLYRIKTLQLELLTPLSWVGANCLPLFCDNALLL